MLLISCSQKSAHLNKQTTQVDKKHLLSNDTLAFLQKHFYSQEDSCHGENCSYISLDYPFYLKEPNLNDILRSEIISFLDVDDSTAYTKSIDTLFNEVYLVGSQNGDDNSDSTAYYQPTTMGLTIQRINETPDIITLQLTHDASGGAHPNEEIHFINWDKKHDKNIALDDIMKANYEDKLNNIAEKIFRNEEGLSITDTLSAYQFEDGVFALNNNFAITDTSLSFFYNTYEIQSYMQGTTTIDIPYKDIKRLINKKSVISKLIK
jgi:hypothetical protein